MATPRKTEEGDLSREDKIKTRVITRILDRWQGLGEGQLDFPASYMQCFYLVALRPGLSITEIAEILGVSRQAVSRMCLEIGPKSRRGEKPGLELIEQYVSHKDLRSKAYYLTPAGRALFKQIMDDMEVIKQ